jgi:pathogenesis-related protein 1
MVAMTLPLIACKIGAKSSNTDGGSTDGKPASGDGRKNDAPAAGLDAASGVGEPAELAGMTLYHNQARLAENASPPLPQLTWDPALAQIAADWGAKCQDVDQPIGLIDHNPGRSATYPTYVGENIYGGASSAQAAVDLWMTEKPNYNYAANSCSGVCGHYTQIVWRNTVKVGCAISHCPSLRFSDSIICDYGPGGNYNGTRPY